MKNFVIIASAAYGPQAHNHGLRIRLRPLDRGLCGDLFRAVSSKTIAAGRK